MKTPDHGGNLRALARAFGRPEGGILDFSASLNPLGPPEWLRPLLSSRVSSLAHYPDPESCELRAVVADRYGTTEAEVMLGNGSTEILSILPRALGRKKALVMAPSYGDYRRWTELAGMEIETWPLVAEQDFRTDFDALERRMTPHSLILLGRPNNPDGQVCDAEELRQLATRRPDVMFLVDEAFGDFVEGFESLTTRRPSNVIVLLSLTKSYAIPGLRLGCAIADAEIARGVRRLQPAWTVNTLAQAVGVAALRDVEYLRRTREQVRQWRDGFLRGLRAAPGLTIWEGRANYLLARIESVEGGLDAPKLAECLIREEGMALRVCENFQGLDGRYFRVAVRTEDENTRLCHALRRTLEGKGSGARRRASSVKRRTPSIMFQGTSSNAGKSVLTAAFCRILLQDGYRVAPFKSQNMSLNSFVTRDGGEMGRAQVVQAQACRIEPDVRMNPILMKPNSETGAQVILGGRSVGNMDVEQYIRFKPEAFAAATSAYDSLASEHDVMVLEGAGSPAEVNLKQHDIVNMNMARHANAPVLLVGDIDRGGVFASFVGTMEVLAEWERAQVMGFVVNRFRGRESLLREALDYTERHTGRPVLGVVPYLSRLDLPEEDSVTFKGAASSGHEQNGGCVEIAVVDLPHISNFTDFDALRIETDVRVRVVRSAGELGRPDAVILPGSKNVIADLAHLREHGLDREIKVLADEGQSEVIGLCGGYQMLGERIEDPQGVESANGEIRGMGLLRLSTVMAREKTLVRAEAMFTAANAAGLRVHGYEIHHGQSRASGLEATVRREDGEVIGAGRADGRVWGTYLHGIFDADEFRRWFIDRLRSRRGWPALGKVCARYDLEPSFERLAEVVRQRLDLPRIYERVGLR